MLQPLFCSAAGPASFQVLSNAFSACRTKLQCFLLQEGKEKSEGVCPWTHPTAGLPLQDHEGSISQQLLECTNYLNPQILWKLKQITELITKRKNNDTEGLSLTSKAKSKLMCTSSLLWSCIKRSAKVSGRTKFSDHLFNYKWKKSSCRKCQQHKLQVLRRFPVW